MLRTTPSIEPSAASCPETPVSADATEIMPAADGESLPASPAPSAQAADDPGSPGAQRTVQPLRALGAGSLPVAGGKGANLGILLQAALPVPDGFCVTTDAYAEVAAATNLHDVVARLAEVRSDDIARLATLAGEAREILLAAPIPSAIAEAIGAAYRDLSAQVGGPARVAVRSSATAEDLP